jgi:hypothetical protein
MQRAISASILVMLVGAVNGEPTVPERALLQALPVGWSVVERKEGEIPWGHHWCEDYKGVTGTKLVIRGPARAKSRFRDSEGHWTDVAVGAEALEVWVMPTAYEEGWRNNVCFHRPIQPDSVVASRAVRLYARPAAHQNSDEQALFQEQLAKATAVESPESPWNDPKRISWQSWSADLRRAFEK